MTTETNRVFVAIVPPVVFVALPHTAAAETWQGVHAIFEERCVACHSGEYAPLGLALDSYPSLMSGSENGPVVDIEAPGQSALVQRLTGLAEPRMPLDGPPFLSDAEIATVTAWMAAGAIGPETESLLPVEPVDPYQQSNQSLHRLAAKIICFHLPHLVGQYLHPKEKDVNSFREYLKKLPMT